MSYGRVFPTVCYGLLDAMVYWFGGHIYYLYSDVYRWLWLKTLDKLFSMVGFACEFSPPRFSVVFLVDSFLNWNWSIINCTILLLRKIRDNIVCSTNTSHAEFMDGVIKIYQMWSVCHPIFSIWFCQCWHWNLAMRAGCLPDPELFFPFVLCSKYFSL